MDAAPVTGGCPEVPARRLTSGTVLEFPFDLFLKDQPFVYGESNPWMGGVSIVPLNVRFYVSEVALLRAGAEPLPVDIVTASGAMQPYGVHMFNAEEPASRSLRVLAPAGAYTGFRFLLGLNAGCDTDDSAVRQAPLSTTSQMTWAPPFGYLFLRYEARFEPAGGADLPPGAIHMGGVARMELAPIIRVEGALSVPTTGAVSKTVRVHMDQIFVGATTPLDVTDTIGPPGNEVIAGERLRRTAAGLQIFTFGP